MIKDATDIRYTSYHDMSFTDTFETPNTANHDDYNPPINFYMAGLEITASEWTISGKNGFCLVKCLDDQTFCLVIYASRELFVQLNKVGNYRHT